MSLVINQGLFTYLFVILMSLEINLVHPNVYLSSVVPAPAMMMLIAKLAGILAAVVTALFSYQNFSLTSIRHIESLPASGSYHLLTPLNIL